MKRFFKYGILLFFIILIFIAYTNYPRLNIIAGYSAKNMNSSVFLAGRDAEFTDRTDNNFSPVNLASDKIDQNEKLTTASVYGLLTRKAIYREGLGSVLLLDNSDRGKIDLIPRRNKIEKNLSFPYGDLDQKDTLFDNVNYAKLEESIDHAFDSLYLTRSVIVIYKDHIIGERYANGFNKNSKLLGWSMTKSITATIFGVLERQGRLNINDKAPVSSWKNDERSQITISDLLHMNSGLEWDEDYNSISDVTKMLFLAKDMAKIQEEKEFVGKPDNSWNYSSGTTNLLSGILRNQFNSHQEYLDFWYSDLIDKIGMHSMLIETDLSGNYVGSSYGWATPRDWSKFGLLYLKRGNWNGEQVFDESWVDYVITPTQGSNGEYGGHFWLNAGGVYPDAPKDLFSANGYQGQRVFIIPSLELVIVRMGLTEEPIFDFNKFLKGIITSIN